MTHFLLIDHLVHNFVLCVLISCTNCFKKMLVEKVLMYALETHARVPFKLIQTFKVEEKTKE